MDDATADRDRLDFARVCVEVTPACEFPDRVKILVRNKWVEQVIDYEWRPHCCSHYNSFEHNEASCNNLVSGRNVIDGLVGKQTEKVQGEWKTLKHRKKVGSQVGRLGKHLQANSNFPAKVWREKAHRINDIGANSNGMCCSM